LFVGDAAHQVSPFGARGANSGFQDADDLMWKLSLVIKGQAPDRLLDSYALDRQFAADENIMNSTRSTDFITPKSAASRTLRNAVLQLAREHPFARKLVNSGRLSVPSFYVDSPLNTPADAPFEGAMEPGAPMDDAPVAHDGRPGWLLDHTGGRFQLMVYADDPAALDVSALLGLRGDAVPVELLVVSPRPGTEGPGGATLLHDAHGLVARRYDARDGSAFLLRPDQHLAARWRAPDLARVRAAVARATCND
jgi:3-(3-hydroxy-phenyl)propionate hydroxylase